MTHTICKPCNARLHIVDQPLDDGGLGALLFGGGGEEPCCWCGIPTADGIPIEISPRERVQPPCEGNHV